MSSFANPHRRSIRTLLIVLLALVLAGVIVAAITLWPRFESTAPQITLSSNADTAGVTPLRITITDQGTGLKAFSATLSQGGTEHRLSAEQLAQATGEKTLDVALLKVPGIKEGPATLKITAQDRALWSGNAATLEKAINIDITPPTLELIADDRYINFGGVGVVVYKPSADTATSGVKLGERFFPGVTGQIKDHPEYALAFFAHAYDIAADARPVLVATDSAGNTRELRLAYELKDVRYKKSTIALSDGFLQNKIAPLLHDVSARQGSPKELFVAVNERLRKDNDARIAAITSKVTPAPQWQGAFAQLSNSKVEANFADQRTYTYNGEAISTAYHLGYDLSVTKNYPVEASNAGTVAFAGDLGIYGNAVILDHGLGLYTLYSHLNSINVKDGASVVKRQIVGKTGETGLAAGDHLHFGVYLHGVAVLPVEWWDQKWIDDNITPKLAGRTGQELTKAARPVKAAKKTAAKRRR